MKGFNDWINSQPNEDTTKLKQIWDLTASYKQGYRVDTENAHDNFMAQLQKEPKPASILYRMNTRRRWMSAAAMIAVLIVAGLFVKNIPFSVNGLEKVATDGTEWKDLTLADGSVVNLNGNSALLFPPTFSEAKRIVELSGEAFFDVVKDDSKPFIIKTEKAVITVLGTSFNVRSFPGKKKLEVAVASGSVAVEIDGMSSQMLTAGDLLSFDYTTASLTKEATVPENASAWKSGQLRFKKTPLDKIFKTLERLHDVTIVSDSDELNTCPFTISLNSLNLENAFAGLSAACDLEFIAAGKNKFMVKGSCCD